MDVGNLLLYTNASYSGSFDFVRDFAARIEKGARFCKYKAGLLGDTHEEAIRDQFVFVLREGISGPSSFEKKQRPSLMPCSLLMHGKRPTRVLGNPDANATKSSLSEQGQGSF